ncbi:DUF5107 domain-containing protein, partial [Microbacterium oleivorans]
PDDGRAHTMLGSWRLARGEYTAAREHLEAAVARETRRNLNPRDGEAHYLLGLALERLGERIDADRRFARAAWNAVWAAPASLARARLALADGRPADALRLADTAGPIAEARRLRVLALRRLGRDDRAALDALIATDPLDPITVCLTGAAPSDPRAALDAGAEFARAGALDEALAATAREATGDAGFGNLEPVRLILRAAWADAAGRPDLAAAERSAADRLDLGGAFPAGLDQHDALVAGAAAGSSAAAGMLGAWLLDAGRDDDAHAAVRRARDLGSDDPVALRNLALATVRTGGDPAEAADLYEAGLGHRPDPRLVLERDLLAQLTGTDAAARLALMERHPAALDARDDLAISHVGLLLDTDRVDDAWRILTTRVFRPFEGGEGIVLAAYDRAACLLARRSCAEGRADAAIALLEAGIAAPANLGEGRHPAVPQGERFVALGDAHRLAGDGAAARAAWERACAATPLAVAPRPADEATFWIGVAHTRLGETSAADAIWDALDARAAQIEAAPDEVDYFATSLPELLVFDLDTADRRRAHAAALRDLATDGRTIANERMNA